MAEGFEPSQIPGGGEHAQIWKDGQLKAAFDPLNATNAFNSRDQYINVVNLWQQGVETFARSTHRSISEAWEGASAEAAKNAITNYSQDALNLTQPLTDLASHVNDTAEAVMKTKNSIPDPVHIDATSWLVPWHRFTLEEQQGQHRQEAWDHFINHYVTPLGQIDSQIPVLPPASDPTRPVNAPAPGDQSPGGPGFSSGPGHLGGPGSGPGSANQPGHQQPGSQDPNHQDPNQQNPNPQDSKQSPGGPNPADSPQTTPSGLHPPTSPSSMDPNATSTTPSSIDPGGLGSSSGTGSPGGSGSLGGPGVGGGPGSTSGGPGRSIPGGPAGGQNPAAASAARPAANASGMPGMPGLGAARGKGEGDKEHTTPDYLINAENARELIGDPPRTLPDGVIGGGRQGEDRPRPE
ncbi:MAG: hypothetical protein J2P18_01095 [Nocardia sp.]|nr:hypothetical protein [Nocardia sp.]